MNAPLRKVPAGSIQHQSRAKLGAVTQCGDLTPVRQGGMGFHYMVCSKGHEGLYRGSQLRQSIRAGSPQRCRECMGRAVR